MSKQPTKQDMDVCGVIWGLYEQTATHAGLIEQPSQQARVPTEGEPPRTRRIPTDLPEGSPAVKQAAEALHAAYCAEAVKRGLNVRRPWLPVDPSQIGGGDAGGSAGSAGKDAPPARA